MPACQPQVQAEPWRLRPRTLVVGLSGRLRRGDVGWICSRFTEALTAHETDLVVCDVGWVVDPDAVTLDVVARLRLAARPRPVRLRRVPRPLRELLVLVGMYDAGGLHLETWWQSEQREQRGGVEEEVGAGDLAT